MWNCDCIFAPPLIIFCPRPLPGLPHPRSGAGVLWTALFEITDKQNKLFNATNDGRNHLIGKKGFINHANMKELVDAFNLISEIHLYSMQLAQVLYIVGHIWITDAHQNKTENSINKHGSRNVYFSRYIFLLHLY